jgi:hypothetical protein
MPPPKSPIFGDSSLVVGDDGQSFRAIELLLSSKNDWVIVCFDYFRYRILEGTDKSHEFWA